MLQNYGKQIVADPSKERREGAFRQAEESTLRLVRLQRHSARTPMQQAHRCRKLRARDAINQPAHAAAPRCAPAAASQCWQAGECQAGAQCRPLAPPRQTTSHRSQTVLFPAAPAQNFFDARLHNIRQIQLAHGLCRLHQPEGLHTKVLSAANFHSKRVPVLELDGLRHLQRQAAVRARCRM